MRVQMTETARGIARKNALVSVGGLLASWGAVATVLSLVFAKSFFVSFGLAMPVLFVSVFLIVVIGWFHGRTVAGPVLLDCGAFPMQKEARVMAVLTLIGCGFAGTSLKVFGISAPIFGILCAVGCIIQASGRLQLRENGIWLYWSLLRWRKIGSYRWTDDSTLVWKPNRYFGLLQRATSVPPEHMQAFADMLARRCPASPSVKSGAAADQ